jgi:outer membrane cobalamin receptor
LLEGDTIVFRRMVAHDGHSKILATPAYHAMLRASQRTEYDEIEKGPNGRKATLTRASSNAAQGYVNNLWRSRGKLAKSADKNLKRLDNLRATVATKRNRMSQCG